MGESRTKNTVRNVRTGAIVQVIKLLLAFVVRTFFIRLLNKDYLGVEGLFTNILTILSFAELGIGNAIIFNMYKPIAENDEEKIKSLMKLYKKAYNIIGVAILVIGAAITPFLGFIIKEKPNISENLSLIYILYLINTSVSYFFSYKKSIIIAHQKQSVINNITSVFYVLKSICEILFLYLTRNFIVYLVLQIVFTIITNVVFSIRANKMYPYLKDTKVKSLEKSVSKRIFSNVRAIVVYKFGGVILGATDNIIISSMINVGTVGLVSNYNMIITGVQSVLTLSVVHGVEASVGNLNAIASKEKKEKIFYELNFIDYIIYSFCALAFVVLLNPFIKLWLGMDFVLHQSIPIALAVSFYVSGIRNPAYIYRTTNGLFEKGKLAPYLCAIINIVTSIILCKFLGVLGVFIGTSIAQLCSLTWIDPLLIHKHVFNNSAKKYFKKYFIYFLVFVINIVILQLLSNLIEDTGVVSFIIKLLMVAVIPNVINIIIFRKSEEYISSKETFLKPIISKILKKVKRKGKGKDKNE